MCKNVNCPMYGGACGLKTMDGVSNLMVCPEYAEEPATVKVFILSHVVVGKDGVPTVYTSLHPTETAAMMGMTRSFYENRSKGGSNARARLVRGSARMTEQDGTLHVWNIDHDEVVLDESQYTVRNGEVRVKTPVGVLVARDQENSDYPGIMVDLECNYGGEGESIGIANIEWGTSEDDKTRRICASLFRNHSVDECTDYLAYEGGEEALSKNVPAVLVGIAQDGAVSQTGCKVNVNAGIINGILDRKVCAADKTFVMFNGMCYPARAHEEGVTPGENGLEFVFDA